MLIIFKKKNHVSSEDSCELNKKTVRFIDIIFYVVGLERHKGE